MTNEGELYKKIRKIGAKRFQFEKADNDLKMVVQDMVNMNRAHDAVAVECVLDKAKADAPKDALKKLDPLEWIKWFEHYFGEASE